MQRKLRLDFALGGSFAVCENPFFVVNDGHAILAFGDYAEVADVELDVVESLESALLIGTHLIYRETPRGVIIFERIGVIA